MAAAGRRRVRESHGPVVWGWGPGTTHGTEQVAPGCLSTLDSDLWLLPWLLTSQLRRCGLQNEECLGKRAQGAGGGVVEKRKGGEAKCV